MYDECSKSAMIPVIVCLASALLVLIITALIIWRGPKPMPKLEKCTPECARRTAMELARVDPSDIVSEQAEETWEDDWPIFRVDFTDGKDRWIYTFCATTGLLRSEGKGDLSPPQLTTKD